MTKQELIQFFTDCIATQQGFLNVCTTDDEVVRVVDIQRAKANIDIINIWIDEVMKDINSNLIPESFFEKLKHDVEHNIPTQYYTSFRPNESKLLSFKSISEQLSGINNLIEIYAFYKALGFAQQNTVIVGANGCGKTSLANLLQKSLNISDGIVIPAQKLLIFPSFANTPTYNSAQSHFDKYQKSIYDDKVTFDAQKMDDFEWQLTQKYGSEMVKVLGMLLGQRQLRINQAASKYSNDESVSKEDFRGILDDVIEIWNQLIEHRTLLCNDSNQLKIKYGSIIYDAHQMSDGERVIIYLAGRVLFAPKDSIIITDEPELHLHKSIANKLWDLLENKRSDCRFIYFTHDLDFATSRNCQKGWIKNFHYPNSWSIELIQENIIPEELLLKLVGSRKPILFCEGKVNSPDKQIYEVLFPNYTIQEVDSCKNVINYTKAFNSIPGVSTKAHGIIDKDFRNSAQISKFEQEGIFTYGVSEIENLLISEEFLSEYCKVKSETVDIEKIKEHVLSEFKNSIESQISLYLSAYIDFMFKECHLRKADTKEKVQENYNTFLSGIDIEETYKKRKEYLSEIIDSRNYKDLITVANHKGLTTKVAQEFGLRGRNEYIERAIQVIRRDLEAQNIIKNYFPDALTQI